MIRTYIEKRFPGDQPSTVAVRQYLATVCSWFVSTRLADSKFTSELTSGSEPKFWACVSEALIADRLRDNFICTREKMGAGPDFLVMAGARKVWIEVVCPEPIGVPADWLGSQPIENLTFPHEAILLRWTSAIKAKTTMLMGGDDEMQKGYLNTGQVAPEDAYVIAVNGCQLRNGPWSTFFGISQVPFAVEAVFPVGPLQLKITKDTLKIVERGYQHRPFVLNKNHSEVSTEIFLNPRFSSVSAIWAVDLDGSSVIGNSCPSAVVHNPNALNPVSQGFLPSDNEYVADLKKNCLVVSRISASVTTAGKVLY